MTNLPEVNLPEMDLPEDATDVDRAQAHAERYASSPNETDRAGVMIWIRSYVEYLVNRHLEDDDRSLCGCDAEDLVQDGIIEAGRLLERYDPSQSKFVTILWYKIRTVVSNYMRSVYPRRGRPVTFDSLDAEENEHWRDTLPSPDRADRPAQRESSFRLVDQALRSLPEKQERAVRRYHLAGETAASIASDTGVTRQSVHRRIQKGETRLKRMLTKRMLAGQILSGA